ncbi:hypothetical protein E2C01_087074 [Portunus trituberculatus]|uniref:Uncharacterized protein n=1 Tax=Portunus trituberculatus TaxID=210409 RepID=A0A5B7JD38_PORTR|nr:hypothetical protein [Portunus trituberculatus]
MVQRDMRLFPFFARVVNEEKECRADVEHSPQSDGVVRGSTTSGRRRYMCSAWMVSEVIWLLRRAGPASLFAAA